MYMNKLETYIITYSRTSDIIDTSFMADRKEKHSCYKWSSTRIAL